jgi:hypothetical protein
MDDESCSDSSNVVGVGSVLPAIHWLKPPPNSPTSPASRGPLRVPWGTEDSATENVAPTREYGRTRRRCAWEALSIQGKPDSEDVTLVKRVLGLPEDKIALREGVLFPDGLPQNERTVPQPSRANVGMSLAGADRKCVFLLCLVYYLYLSFP